MTDKSYVSFLTEAEAIVPCTEEELSELIPSASSGNREAMDRLVEGNLYRVLEAASFFAGNGQNKALLMDLIQEGNMALFLCLSEEYRYTEDTGRRMDAAIRDAMERFLEEEKDQRSAGEELKVKLNVIDEVCVRLTEKLQREPTAAEVAGVMQMEESDVKYLLKIALSAIKKD